ncbi:hypothetical protein Scep_009696 [Stephania cephalantha]|uniref:Uncharacterized protein n=1 Tax=Stephania cephalantha TaxID=152367 RepID=A0AAP0JUP0_9MAGN
MRCCRGMDPPLGPARSASALLFGSFRGVGLALEWSKGKSGPCGSNQGHAPDRVRKREASSPSKLSSRLCLTLPVAGGSSIGLARGDEPYQPWWRGRNSSAPEYGDRSDGNKDIFYDEARVGMVKGEEDNGYESWVQVIRKRCRDQIYRDSGLTHHRWGQSSKGYLAEEWGFGDIIPPQQCEVKGTENLEAHREDQPNRENKMHQIRTNGLGTQTGVGGSHNQAARSTNSSKILSEREMVRQNVKPLKNWDISLVIFRTSHVWEWEMVTGLLEGVLKRSIGLKPFEDDSDILPCVEFANHKHAIYMIKMIRHSVIRDIVKWSPNLH